MSFSKAFKLCSLAATDYIFIQPIMKKRLLIIEEHEHFRKLLSVYLSKGFQVLPARNGVEAMGWIKKGFLPNIIISGTVAPNSNTEDFLNSVQYSGTLAGTPMISISPEPQTDAISLKALEKRILGVFGPASKPITPEPVIVSEQTAVVLS